MSDTVEKTTMADNYDAGFINGIMQAPTANEKRLCGMIDPLAAEVAALREALTATAIINDGASFSEWYCRICDSRANSKDDIEHSATCALSLTPSAAAALILAVVDAAARHIRSFDPRDLEGSELALARALADCGNHTGLWALAALGGSTEKTDG